MIGMSAGLGLQFALRDRAVASSVVVAARRPARAWSARAPRSRPLARRAASACASAISRSSSTTRQIRPHSAAVSAGNGSASSASARARAVPTRRGRNQVPPQSGIRPMRGEGLHKARRARRQHDVAGEREIGAGAGGDAVDGADDRQRQRADLQDQRVVMRRADGRFRPAPAPTISVRSCPAQKPRPAPVSSIARQVLSASAVVERGIERGGHLHRQRIQPLRPVQRDPAIPGKLLDEMVMPMTLSFPQPLQSP